MSACFVDHRSPALGRRFVAGDLTHQSDGGHRHYGVECVGGLRSLVWASVVSHIYRIYKDVM